jgi:hypothetical protein
MKRILLTGLVCGALAGCTGPYPADAYYGAPGYGYGAPGYGYGAAGYGYGAPGYGGAASAAAPAGGLQQARLACNDTYPVKIGNYRAHADCVNAAVERYGLAGESHPELVRLQEQARATLSGKIDQGVISAHTGEKKMNQADQLLAEARRQRDAGQGAAADRSVARVEALLQ